MYLCSNWVRTSAARTIWVMSLGLAVPAGALDGDVDADSGALVAGVGQRGHPEGRGPVQGGQGVGARR